MYFCFLLGRYLYKNYSEPVNFTMRPLFQQNTRKQQYALFYNLSPFLNHFYLPSAFICGRDRKGNFTYLLQKVYQKNVAGFGFELIQERRQLFEIIEKLQVKAIEQRFNPPKKRAKSLDKLLEDKELKKLIVFFVDKNLDQFLTLIARHQLNLCWNALPKIPITDLLLDFPHYKLNANVYFKKSGEQVHYALRMQEGRKEWEIKHKQVVPLVNEPAWVFVDYQVFQVQHINGNMVKPFMTKREVIIPKRHVKTYFQTFIVKIAEKVNIETIGFDLIKYREILTCDLQVYMDIFKKQPNLSLKFAYEKASFSWKDKQDQKTILDFKGEEVIIHQVKRSPYKEKQWIEKLLSFRLEIVEDSYFQLTQNVEHTWHLIEWLSEYKEVLEAVGFSISSVVLEQKELILAKPNIELNVSQKNDWLDIYGDVTVGKFTFPFIKLANYIREQNYFYPLPDGTFFVIPQEWMEKYQGIFQFGRSKEDLLSLEKSQFSLLKSLGLKEGVLEEAKELAADVENMDYQPSPLLQATLRPYQLEGVKWLVHHYQQDFGACLADDMGLGKTLQTIAVLLHAKEQKSLTAQATNSSNGASKTGQGSGLQLGLFGGSVEDDFLQPLQALIILPASLVFNWENEIQKFAPTLMTYRHLGTKRHKDIKVIKRFDVVLTTYQTALRDVDFLQKIEFSYVVLDESQQIKNKDSKIFKAINQLQAAHKVSLSGTPIENSLSDLWSQMQFINPNLLGSFRFFKREFITPIEKQRDEAKTERLKDLIAPFLLRRTKDLVAKDLPPLTEKVFYSEMSKEQKRLYEKEKSAARNYLLDNYNAKDFKYHSIVLTTLLKLRQIANHPTLIQPDYRHLSGKFEDIIEHLKVIRKGGHKTLIFSTFVKYLDLFKKYMEEEGLAYAWLSGSTSQNQRVKAIQQFETDKNVSTFLISLKAGGTGLNLVAADYVFILDPWFNPAAEQQAIARAHRIGQTKQVIAIKFISKDTVEEKILKLQARKSQLVEDIIDNNAKMNFSKKDIAYLFE